MIGSSIPVALFVLGKAIMSAGLPCGLGAVLAPAQTGGSPRQSSEGELLLVAKGPLSCPSLPEVKEALERRFGPVSTSTLAPAKAVLRVEAVGDRVRLELETGKSVRPLTRDVPIHGAHCAALADTVALIADSWSRELPWRGKDAVLPEVSPSNAIPAPSPFAGTPGDAPPIPRARLHHARQEFHAHLLKHQLRAERELSAKGRS